MKNFTLTTLFMSLITMISWGQCTLQADFQYWLNGNDIAMGDSSLNVNNNTIYSWAITGDDNSSFTGSGINYAFTPVDSVTYNMCITITDGTNQNCTDTQCYSYQYIAPISTPCNAQAGASFVLGPNGLVTFTNTSNGDAYFYGDDNISQNISLNQTFIHTFTTNGTYNVSVNVYDSINNCADTAHLSVVISNISTPAVCSANYNWYQAYDSVGGTWINQVYIVDYSTGSNLSYSWDFGDGSTSNQQYPSHTYANIGQYGICLTVTGNNCTNMFCDTIEVYAKAQGFNLNVISQATVGIEKNISTINVENVYPNPTVGNATLNINAIEYTTTIISILDITGKVIMQQNNTLTTGNNAIELNTQNLSNGIYIISIQTERGNVSNLRLIKK